MGGVKKSCLARFTTVPSQKAKQCLNPVRYGDFCGVHAPDKLKERYAKRRTLEGYMGRNKDLVEEKRALEGRVRELRAVLKTIEALVTEKPKLDAVRVSVIRTLIKTVLGGK